MHEQSTKVFSTKSHFSTNSRKLSPLKDSLYTVYTTSSFHCVISCELSVIQLEHFNYILIPTELQKVKGALYCSLTVTFSRKLGNSGFVKD